MKHLKKLINKYRKQIFALSTFTVIILFSFTCVSAYDYNTPSYYPTNTELPEFPVVYGNNDEVFKPSVGVSTLLPIADVDCFLNYKKNDSVIYDNVGLTITNNRLVQIDNGDLVYDDTIYNYTSDSGFAVKNDVSIISPITGDNAYYYNYKVDFDCKPNSTDTTRINSIILRYSDFWYIHEMKNSSLGYTDNAIRDILNIDIRHSYYNDSDITYRVDGSFYFMGNTIKHEFDTMIDSNNRIISLGYDDIVGSVFELPDLHMPIPIFIENLTITIPLWSGNISELSMHVKLPVQLSSEAAAYRDNIETIELWSYGMGIENNAIDLVWILNGVNGFMNAEIFAGITFGGIFMVGITCSLTVFILSILNHLK